MGRQARPGVRGSAVWAIAGLDNSTAESVRSISAFRISPATTRIKMRNRIKGEYQDVCYVTGYVNDAEFGVTRDHFGETCDDVGPKLARFKQVERFSSRWIVQ